MALLFSGFLAYAVFDFLRTDGLAGQFIPALRFSFGAAHVIAAFWLAIALALLLFLSTIWLILRCRKAIFKGYPHLRK
ncbi:MAG: hypothetical protein LBT26_06365 [Clostridiales Family XIII bacterium]|nr:hypothetical protein [Clostridiales Family XIII bacterium]